jgi:hypothetical protein
MRHADIARCPEVLADNDRQRCGIRRRLLVRKPVPESTEQRSPTVEDGCGDEVADGI